MSTNNLSYSNITLRIKCLALILNEMGMHYSFREFITIVTTWHNINLMSVSLRTSCSKASFTVG